MPDKHKDQKPISDEALSLQPPLMTVLSDAAIQKAVEESFDLITRLGPVYDILRHPETRTPMAIALYGDWGTGKTSSMRWLRDRLDNWNRAGKAEEKWIVQSVWFEPWKYQSREDVWRGLIAEVIIHSIDLENLKPGERAPKLISAAKQFGGFLGRGFLQALAGLKVGVGAPGDVAKAEYNFAAVRDLYDEYQKTAHPEKAYLNEFETSLKDWLASSLGKAKRTRMVIFIDDLDRCLPAVTLEVLEAVKLYLGIENLIFVFGLDRHVVDRLIVKHYKDNDVPEYKARQYLDKMFQVEVNIAPSDDQMRSFFDQQIKVLNEMNNGFWRKMLSDKHDAVLPKVLRNLARGNPREVKRLLNSTLMAATSAARREPDPDKTPLRFAQGAQVFLIMKVLETYQYMPSDWVRRQEVQEFFRQWSDIVRAHPKVKPPAQGVGVEGDETERGQEEFHRIELRRRIQSGSPAGPDDFSDAPEPYREFCCNWAQKLDRKLTLSLLNDPDLFLLMNIEFSSQVAANMATLSSPAPAEEKPDLPEIIAQAVAQQLRKPAAELTIQDCRNLKELSLSEKKIRDIASLKIFAGLQDLDLSRTEVTDLSPLLVLTGLQTVDLYGTNITDLNPLSSLPGLQTLNLSSTSVTDLNPLRDLPRLQRLNLSGTMITDVSHLSSLTRLRILDLGYSDVKDIAPIASLADLRVLFLVGTKVSDLSPLGRIASLKQLFLSRTEAVRDLSPLRTLSSLEVLFLERTGVTDLSPLSSLTGLQIIDLDDTNVSDISPLGALTNIRQLFLSSTKIEDLRALQTLIGLQTLDIRNTEVREFSPLYKLSRLKKLAIDAFRKDEEQISNLRQALPGLEIRNDSSFIRVELPSNG